MLVWDSSLDMHRVNDAELRLQFGTPAVACLGGFLVEAKLKQ